MLASVERGPIDLVRAAGGTELARVARRGLHGAYAGYRGLPAIWQAVDEFRRRSPQQAKSELAARLYETVQYFGHRADALPEWRGAARARSAEEVWRLWSDLPILSKRDLRDRFPPTEMVQRFGLEGTSSSSGGSTGEPTAVFHDKQMSRTMAALRYYARRKMGWTPGTPTVILWGSERDIGSSKSAKARLSHALQNYWLVDGYALGSHTTDRVLELLASLQPIVIYGFTSMLEYVARDVLARGIAVRAGSVRTAWAGGETLSDAQALLFKQAFGVPILNFYGGRELSSMAYQEAPATSLRVLRPFLFLEIVNERGQPTQPGEVGRLLWTSTVCRGTPFLRYEIGDLGSYEATDLDEAGLHSISALQGRTGGLIKLANGKTIGGLYWNHLMKDYPEVTQFQIGIVANGSAIRLRLVGAGFERAREDQLRTVLREFLGGIQICISWMDEIRRSRTGKLEQIVADEP